MTTIVRGMQGGDDPTYRRFDHKDGFSIWCIIKGEAVDFYDNEQQFNVAWQAVSDD
jgi:hypothetical protein